MPVENPSPGSEILCPLCATAVITRYGAVTDPQTSETFAIDACPTCGLGQTRPRPSDLGRYYGEAYYGSRHGITARMCDRRRVGFLAKMIPTPAKLLDVGCGEGSFMLAAQKAGWDVAGTEINPDRARAKGLRVTTEPEGGPYDCITLWHSLEHLTNPVEMINSLTELLTADGMIVLAVPNAQGSQATIFGRHWLHLDVPRHLYHFGSKSIEKLLGTSGIQVQRVWHSEFEYDLFGWAQSALNAILSPPNILFNCLTGRPHGTTSAKVGVNYLLGGLFLVCALPFARGGTLVVAGRKPAG